MDAELAMGYYHWTSLTQNCGLLQRLIRADPWPSSMTRSPACHVLSRSSTTAIAAYEEAARLRSVVEAWCGDYAAAATIDREHDRDDLGRSVNVPALALWGAKGMPGPTRCRYGGRGSRGAPGAVDAGHFLLEERAGEVLARLRPHLAVAAV